MRSLLEDRRRVTFLWVVVVLALIARLGYSLSLENRPYWYDAREYQSLATGLAATGHYMNADGNPTASWPPGYPFFLAGIYLVTGPNPTAARLVQSVLGALTCLLVYAVARRLVGMTGALLAALITAFYPLFIYTAGNLYPVVLVAFLMTGMVLLVLQVGEHRSYRRSLAAGALGGGIALATPSSLLALLLVAAWLIWFECRARFPEQPRSAGAHPEGRRWKCVAPALCFLLPIVLMMGAWSLRNDLVLGDPVIGSTNGGFNFWLGNHPDATATSGNLMSDAMREELGTIYAADHDEVARDRALTHRALEYISSDPWRFLKLTIEKAFVLWSFYPQPISEDRPRVAGERLMSILSYGVLLPFAILWLVRALWRDPRAWLVLLICLAYTAVHAVFIAKVRFRLPVDPLVILYGAGGIVGVIGWIGSRRRAAGS